MRLKYLIAPVILMTALMSCTTEQKNDRELIRKAEFIYQAEDVPFPSCHASTIAETPGGMTAAWFGGTHEKNKDVGIWFSREVEGKWTVPVEVANGVQNDTLRYPTWNPVLFNAGNKLVLFYKVGPSPRDWWGEMMTSEDNGESWSASVRLPDGILGPIKNKPVLLENGELLCPSSTEDNGWQVHMELTPDLGKSWERTPALNNGDAVSAIQPTVLIHPDGQLQMLCRTKSNLIYTSFSSDQGRSWSPLEPTSLPNNNSGIDAVTLHDGRFLLVYNHIDRSKDQGKRNKLHVAISKDGIHWNAVAMLENDPDVDHEYSYPAVIQSHDGMVHITYTWRRELIRHVILDPEQTAGIPIKDGQWPEELQTNEMTE